MEHKIYLIAAVDLKGGMGLKSKLPWNLPGDMKFFQKTTIKTENMQYRNMVVMGRVTWESIPKSHRPLMGRKNVVISHNKNYKIEEEGVILVNSIQEALKAVDERIANIFVIGGAKIFDQFLKRYKVDGIYLTRIKKEYKCDIYFPKLPANFVAEKLGEDENGGVKYEFLFYKKGAIKMRAQGAGSQNKKTSPPKRK